MLGNATVDVTSPSRPTSAPQHSCGYVSTPWVRIASATSGVNWRLLSTSVHSADERPFGRLLPEPFGQVLLAAIAEDRDDHAVGDRVGDTQRRRERRAARDTDEQSLFQREALREQVRLFGAD